jgi:hypothetical protein
MDQCVAEFLYGTREPATERVEFDRIEVAQVFLPVPISLTYS